MQFKLQILITKQGWAAIIMIALSAFFISCEESRESFNIEVLNSYTPIKNQGKSQTCWAYAMLAAIETEHIMQGDSVNLSAAWVERMMEQDSLAPKSKRGMGITLVNMINRYGLVPYDVMKKVEEIPPRQVFFLGACYTPLEFAHSVCRPNEYISLGCSEQHPYNELFVLDSPDNWEHNQLLNLTADSLLKVTEKAVRLHHGACWEGDIHEMGFNWEQGVARTSLVSGKTTDDHCMAIVGLARDMKWEPYFIMKNSWGTKNPYDGLMFMSYGYFQEKTIAVFLPREVL